MAAPAPAPVSGGFRRPTRAGVAVGTVPPLVIEGIPGLHLFIRMHVVLQFLGKWGVGRQT